MNKVGQPILFLIPILLLVLWGTAPRDFVAPEASDLPAFSSPPGLYDSPLRLSLQKPGASTQIRYTLDGSEPDSTSTLFTGPVLLEKTTVVKAIADHSENLKNKTLAGTFLIDERIAPDFPVVSLSMDSMSLFDTVQGHYTRGDKSQWADPSAVPNYWKRVEFPMHFEYFNPGGERVLEQKIGAKIFGNASRELPQKSFRLTARKKYGKNRFEHNFFPNKDLFSFKSIVLRNSGTDWNFSHIRDAFVHNWVEGRTFLDTQAARPCIVFINGKYWGVYHLREYIDGHMIGSNHDLNPDFINVIEGSLHPRAGDVGDFNELCQFVDTHDLSLDANYDSVCSELDVKNLVDYWAVEVWAANWDWMDANVRFWREAVKDTPWRYVLWDVDRGMGPMEQFGKNPLRHHVEKTNLNHVRLIRELNRNEKFRKYLISRNADLLNTVFAPSALLQELRLVFEKYVPAMRRHFEIWNEKQLNQVWGKTSRGSYAKWLISIDGLRNFIIERQGRARAEWQEVLGLNKQVPLQLNVSPPEAGRIQVNTVEVEEFPWKGVYFEGIPVTLTALPNPGYAFEYWENPSENHKLDEPRRSHIELSDWDSFTAHFSGVPQKPVLTVTEIKYQKNLLAKEGDWVELHNPGSVPFDLGGWRLKDDNDKHRFVFPEGTVVPAGSYLVVVQDTAAFDSVYPGLQTRLGPLPFGFSKKGDQVRLFNRSLEEYLGIRYQNTLPWPHVHRNENVSLELIDPQLPLNIPANWRKSIEGGSPGAANPHR